MSKAHHSQFDFLVVSDELWIYYLRSDRSSASLLLAVEFSKNDVVMMEGRTSHQWSRSTFCPAHESGQQMSHTFTYLFKHNMESFKSTWRSPITISPINCSFSSGSLEYLSTIDNHRQQQQQRLPEQNQHQRNCFLSAHSIDQVNLPVVTILILDRRRRRGTDCRF